MSFKDRQKTRGNRHIAYEYFIDKGYKPHLAAAIVGNLMQESHTRLDNTIVNSIGAVGIAQWLGPRRANLKQFAKNQRRDYKDLDTQLDFLDWELKGGQDGWLSKRDRESFLKSKSIDEAAEIFGNRFERAGAHEMNMNTRKKYARTLAQEYGDNNIYSKDDKGNIVVAPGSDKIPGRRAQFAKGEIEEKAVDNTYAQGPYTGKYSTKEGWEEMSEEDFKTSDAAKREYYDQALAEMEELDRQERAKAGNAKISASTQKLEEEVFVDAVAEAIPTPQQQQQAALQEEVKASVFGREPQPEQQTPVAAVQPQEESNLYAMEDIAENEFLAQLLGEEFEVGGESTIPLRPKLPTVTETIFADYTTPIPTKSNENISPNQNTTTYKGLKLKSGNTYQGTKSDTLNATAQVRETTKINSNPTLENIEKVKLAPKAITKDSISEATITTTKQDILAAEVMEQRKQEYAKRSNNLDLEATDKTLSEDNYKTEQQVRALQQFLTNKGYNLNPEGRFKNKGVDGKLGKVTREALQNYNSSGPEGEYVNYKKGEGLLGGCKEEQCSEYVQNEIFRNFKPNMERDLWNASTGLHGDAWDLGNNIVAAGGKQVPINKIQKGDVVGIFTGTTGRMGAQAQAVGKNYTHSGVVDEVNPDGTYYVLHNFHKVEDKEYKGQEFRTLVDPKKGYRLIDNDMRWKTVAVKEAFRPNYEEGTKFTEKRKIRDDVRIELNPNEIDNINSLNKGLLAGKGIVVGGTMSEKVNEFIEPLNDLKTKKVLMSKFNLNETEYQSLSKAALGILAQEASFGTSPLATLKEPVAVTAEVLGLKKEASRGAGRIKYETNFGNQDLNEFGINKDNFNASTKNTVVTLMHILSQNYQGLTHKTKHKNQALYKAIQKYNKGYNDKYAQNHESDYVNKVINYANLFTVKDNSGKEYNTFTEDIGLLKPVAVRATKQLKSKPRVAK